MVSTLAVAWSEDGRVGKVFTEMEGACQEPRSWGQTGDSPALLLLFLRPLRPCSPPSLCGAISFPFAFVLGFFLGLPLIEISQR